AGRSGGKRPPNQVPGPLLGRGPSRALTRSRAHTSNDRPRTATGRGCRSRPAPGDPAVIRWTEALATGVTTGSPGAAPLTRPATAVADRDGAGLIQCDADPGCRPR